MPPEGSPPPTPGPTPPLPAVAVVVSRYNGSITDRLRDGAVAAYLAKGGRREDLQVFDAPGSFELTVLAAEAARSGRFAGVVILGCVIKGETRHDEYICNAVAQGITAAAVHTGVPIAFGLLTTENSGQARERAGGIHGNKGEDSMKALLDTITVARAIRGAVPVPSINRPLNDKAAAAPRTPASEKTASKTPAAQGKKPRRGGR